VVSETTRIFYFLDFLDATLDGLVPDQPPTSHEDHYDRTPGHCGDDVNTHERHDANENRRDRVVPARPWATVSIDRQLVAAI
jgi:hypothetical protein